MTDNFSIGGEISAAWKTLRGWLSAAFAGPAQNAKAHPPEYDPNDPAARSKIRLSRVFNEVAGKTIRTERLVIRRWRAEDAKKMAAFYNRDNGLFQTYYFSEDKPKHLRATDFRDYFFAELDRDYPYDLAIFTRDESRIVGMLGFWEDSFRRPHLTYFVSPSERRHGYAFEAYMAELREFGRHGAVDKMTAQVAVDNTASQEFLKKAGFRAIRELTADCSIIEGEPSILMERDMSDLKTPRPSNP